MSDFSEDEEPTERRGRPPLPADQRRTERVNLSFTADEHRILIHRAADADGGPYTVREWARLVLLNPESRP